MEKHEDKRNVSLEEAMSVLQSRLSTQAYSSITQIVQKDLAPIQKPENQKDEEQKNASYWWNVIGEKGGSELFGNAFKRQLIDAGITPANSYQDGNFHGSMSIETVGKKIDQNTVRRSISLRYIKDFIVDRNSMNKGYNSFLFCYQNPVEGQDTLFDYSFLTHNSRTRDVRGNSHLHCSFQFLLPYQESLAFISDLNDNPTLIEEIFMERYSRLVGGEQGLARVKTNKLIVVRDIPDNLINNNIRAPEGGILDSRTRSAQEDKNRKNSKEFIEKHIVEIPVELGEIAA